MTRDTEFIRLALDEAQAAVQHGDVPIGAVVVLDGEVVARGHNTVELTGDASAHAEMNALRLAAERVGGWRLGGCTLYVTIEPCPMCAHAAVLFRIDRLVFGVWNPRSGSAGSLYNIVEDPRLSHHIEVTRGVLAEECAASLVEFFGELRTS